MNSESLFERSKQVVPGGVHSPVRSFSSVGGTPVFFSEANGAYLKSVEGKNYIDYCLSFGPLLFGHRHPEIQEVVEDTVRKAWSFGACEPYSLELAEFITERIPWVEKIRFVNSGTEAVMSALRVARAATGRNKILKFDGCYHGHLDQLLVKSGSGLAGLSSSDSKGIGPEIIQNTLVLPLDDETKLEELFQREESNIACLAIEPLPANYGLLPQRIEFLKKCRELTTKYGVLLLFDEVISGFRVSFQGMAGITGIVPDLVCYGKIIGGGFPVGAYAGKREFMDLVAPSGPVYQAGTLSANPIGMRAGLKTLTKAWNENPYPNLETTTKQFTDGIITLLKESGDPNWEAVTFGSLFWLKGKTEKPIRTIAEIPSSHKSNFATFFHKLLNQGVYLAPSGYEVGFLSTVHTKQIIDLTLEKIKQALKG
ncbi:glutamate-1-semialdehyde 2,1-aminomutase [Leptospira levettii]|uniref:Glutamate-1-semialdehyde 2,1-aminomutase n=1 Tax=Leptospira levettii TaxID=2023178 RepID=A0AAW5VAD1_9LEPT|nr:glutamate-1-semialdehyde 2,1-aminomutase [Leptospira levettii]MCW7464325.1 glutamate-1-semialdehyde 2,1-aminomutase [Leptospira levettii]MCW7495605.1 glutamate-1-semialdehyde 2,1-aminomutase [Leptospira levettii]MCW7511490.1 glutamate-1-semialdehyde 2,1-aminomutase [Leptospira levettii]MCW7515245.1 glutamate-1-semialdehyde 2,1-aminomutase [Leptospira levettii]TGL70107.1 glutamate-1-semialdehyde 2,1-aminomutase [Leptospira levettii]